MFSWIRAILQPLVAELGKTCHLSNAVGYYLQALYATEAVVGMNNNQSQCMSRIALLKRERRPKYQNLPVVFWTVPTAQWAVCQHPQGIGLASSLFSILHTNALLIQTLGSSRTCEITSRTNVSFLIVIICFSVLLNEYDD